MNAREWIADICDAVEDILSEYGIQIPDEDRENVDTDACLYGRSYDLVENSVQNILEQLTVEIKSNPHAEYDFHLY